MRFTEDGANISWPLTGGLFTLKSFDAGKSNTSAYFVGNLARFVSLTELSSDESSRLVASFCSKFTSFNGGDSLFFREPVGDLFTVTRRTEFVVAVADAVSRDTLLLRWSFCFVLTTYFFFIFKLGNFSMRDSRT